jgi:phenylpyruvate tautomerase PptA (4-oxalocrotonate tautomerase family)
MPLVRISLREGTTPEYRKAIADGVHQAMVEAMAVPAKDRFQVITEYKVGDLIYDADYLDVKRSDKIVFVQIALIKYREEAGTEACAIQADGGIVGEIDAIAPRRLAYQFD